MPEKKRAVSVLIAQCPCQEGAVSLILFFADGTREVRCPVGKGCDCFPLAQQPPPVSQGSGRNRRRETRSGRRSAS